ncbi:MAG TPA: biofilm regulation protein phosphatase SiaA [Rhodocyclaceae bacterium]|nr:biofilm regulation protein phosphatase SiaA [Rhodocyclaceae bacterium]
MASWGLGLRAKSMLALALACVLALVPAGVIGWLALDGVRSHFGEAYARNLTLLKRQSIVAPVSRDLALSRRLAGSEVTRRWLLDENDGDQRTLFFREAEGYRRDFRDGSYFVISALNGHYYFNDGNKPFSDAPRYTLDRTDEADAWFFNTMAHTTDYNINVNHDTSLGTTRVWLNVIVRDGERRIGLAGTGLDLDAFLHDFISIDEPGVIPMLIGADGAIQAHPDAQLIAFGSATGAATRTRTLGALLADDAERAALADAMRRAAAAPGEVTLLRATLDGREQLLALSHIPELTWHVVTAVDLNAAHVVEQRWARAAVAAVAALLTVLLAAFGYAVDQLVLRPLRRLQQSATAISQGDYRVELPAAGSDEIGDLSRAFGTMADKVHRHTEELEERVRERTCELEHTNREIVAAHRQIADSIGYASLIQRAILPDGQMTQRLGPRHFVLWRPRDTVGGDFYLFRADGERFLIGVVDCAGHGVPGALMTMLARAAFDQAINEVGIDSPAAILTTTDAAMRAMLRDCELPRGIATNMDAGIACIDRARRQLRYAGARIALYRSDGDTLEVIKGARRALADRRVGTYVDETLVLDPRHTWYLATDGFLDQAGGEQGFSFGNTRFAALLRAHARLPMAEQAAALDRALDAYRGSHSQRDDVTILSFCFDGDETP